MEGDINKQYYMLRIEPEEETMNAKEDWSSGSSSEAKKTQRKESSTIVDNFTFFFYIVQVFAAFVCVFKPHVERLIGSLCRHCLMEPYTV